eukprot:s565_g2.t1
MMMVVTATMIVLVVMMGMVWMYDDDVVSGIDCDVNDDGNADHDGAVASPDEEVPNDPGASELEALEKRINQLLAAWEELTARCRAAEVRVAGLRQEVRERQAQFGQMQQDLKDQIANLRKELNDAAGRRVAHDGGMQEQLRQLELLRHRELQHLRLQEEQLESLQHGEHWEEPVIFATSDPPARLVDPGLMEGSPPQRSYGPGRRSDLRQVMAPSSLVAHWPRDLEASVSSQFTQEDGLGHRRSKISILQAMSHHPCRPGRGCPCGRGFRAGSLRLVSRGSPTLWAPRFSVLLRKISKVEKRHLGTTGI